MLNTQNPIILNKIENTIKFSSLATGIYIAILILISEKNNIMAKAFYTTFLILTNIYYIYLINKYKNGIQNTFNYKLIDTVTKIEILLSIIFMILYYSKIITNLSEGIIWTSIFYQLYSYGVIKICVNEISHFNDLAKESDEYTQI